MDNYQIMLCVLPFTISISSSSAQVFSGLVKVKDAKVARLLVEISRTFCIASIIGLAKSVVCASCYQKLRFIEIMSRLVFGNKFCDIYEVYLQILRVGSENPNVSPFHTFIF
jgi:hypothetical protein